MPCKPQLVATEQRSGGRIRSNRSATRAFGNGSEKADYYIKLHAKTWPGVLQRIKDSNIRNYSVALKEIEGKLFLFSYFEYIGNDFEGDMVKIAADPETQRWWRETDPCQIPLPDAKAQGKIWSDAVEVFHAS
ncbi:L-rhamnose mutarotase [Rudaea cellulosilytica]|uniref:L-rhamnose mutarotase n=1 Tax=Rudaea cellulosilytica TaxID=540746 RepID=UPI0012FA6FEE